MAEVFEDGHRAVDRRRAPASPRTIYVNAVIALSFLGVLSIMALVLLNPNANNAPTITTILGFLVPIILGLQGAAQRQTDKRTDGRLSQLLGMTARTYAAEGKLEGHREAVAAVATVAAAAVAANGDAKPTES